MAVSVLRNAELEKQILAAKRIVEITSSHNIVPKEVPVYLKMFRRRWYDINDDLYNAMESLKASPMEIQKQIAIEVINFLCLIED